jgi:hypothetical protein
MRRALIALVLVLASVLTSVAVNVPPTNAAGPTVTVPVLVCPTGVQAETVPTPVGSSARVPASAAHLVVYSSINGYIQILGQPHWACQAGVGSDGASITVMPITSHAKA